MRDLIDELAENCPDWLQFVPEWLESIYDAFCLMLTDAITAVLKSAFTNINTNVDLTNKFVEKTPKEWNSTIFDFITTISDNIIVPIAGIVITYVLVYELISMIVDKNNFHEFDTSLFIRYIFKAGIAVELVVHSSEIIEAIFEVGGSIVQSVSKQITGGVTIDVADTLTKMLFYDHDEFTMSELMLYLLLACVIWLALWGMSLYIIITLYGRFIEIYLYMSLSPIAFATITNREWGNIGTNYLRGMLALAFQGFLIMVCVGIYSTLILNLGSLSESSKFGPAICEILIYTIVLVVAIGKTGSLSKTLFGAH